MLVLCCGAFTVSLSFIISARVTLILFSLYWFHFVLFLKGIREKNYRPNVFTVSDQDAAKYNPLIMQTTLAIQCAC